MIDDDEVSLDIAGSLGYGKPFCLLDIDENLAEGTSWNNPGFFVSNFFYPEDFSFLYNSVSDLVKAGLEAAGVSLVNTVDFSLDKYHDHCSSDEVHYKVIDYLRNRSRLENLPLGHHFFDDKVSRWCGRKVSSIVPKQAASGHFFIRIVRPFPFSDNNPPHKDIWLDRLRNAINLYVPLAGSNNKSSLSLVPGSHFSKESDIPRTASSAIVNGVRYSVPSIFTKDKKLQMTRPTVNKGEAMLFSPYLIHGGAVNLNSDITRVSLEMRFWSCQG